MRDLIRLETADAAVEIVPALGASILRYDLADGRSVFRPGPQDCADPLATGCFLMAPWCNRIENGVTVGGAFVPVQRNREDQALPIHGSTATASFEVVEVNCNRAQLTARITGPAPFDYGAAVSYALHGASLTITFSVTHHGNSVVPYGLGLHPWFPRDGSISLKAISNGFYRTGADMLPVALAPLSEKPEWDFSRTNALPAELIDTAFSGWDGRAQVRSDNGRGIDIVTEPACGWCQVYSPGQDAGFFCFEPVTHPINAHNDLAHPGLAQLAQGESVSLTTRFIPV